MKINKKHAYKRGSRSIKLVFPEKIDTIKKVKTIPGLKFHKYSDTSFWSIPQSIPNINLLRSWEFILDQSLLEQIKEKKTTQTPVMLNLNGIKLKKGLIPRDYQLKGVEYIIQHFNRALIGDEMGIGKTITAIMWMKLSPHLKPFIIVCPSIAKYNWVDELLKWCPEYSYMVLNGRAKEGIKLDKDITILNYEILANKRKTKEDKNGKKRKIAIKNTGWIDYIIRSKPNSIILDEIHYASNQKSDRGKDIYKLSKNRKTVIGLSGTPIENGPIDFFNICKIIKPGLFRNYIEYGKRYCDAKHNGFGWNFKGSSNLEELHKIITEHMMIRRTKKEVLPELPKLTRTVIPIDITNRKEYNLAAVDLKKWLKQQKGGEGKIKVMALQRIEILKQLIIKGKMKGVFSWIDNFIYSDQKLVIFCTHTKTIKDLMNRYKNMAVMVDGSVTGKKRIESVKEFQTNKRVRLFIANLKAGGVAITLTEASNVATIELGWKGSEHDQANDRIVRFGQKALSLNAWYLLAKNTIEIEIAHLQDKKRKNVDKILEGKETEEDELLTELIKKIKED